MTIRPLRQILTGQSILVAALPVVLIFLFGGFWIMPKVITDVQFHQIQLSTTIASRIEAHLTTTTALFKGVSHMLATLPEKDVQTVLDAQLAASAPLKVLYIVDHQGRVTDMALKQATRDLRKDLLGLDLSRNHLFIRVRQEKGPVWSDTFLSVVGGGLSVALAMPARDRTIIGEMDLVHMTRFLEGVTTSGQQRILVLDRKGQVIADQDGTLTAQQLNLANIPIVRKVLDTGIANSGEFIFNGRTVLGSAVKTGMINWHVLAIDSKNAAYEPIRNAFLILILLLAVAVVFGILFAVLFSNRMARRFKPIADHARQVAAGTKDLEWPETDITEFNSLAADIRHMADTVTQREAYNRLLFADSPMALLVIHPETGQCRDANAAALELMGMARFDQLKGIPVPDLSAPVQVNGENSATQWRCHTETCLSRGRSDFEWLFQQEGRGIWHGDLTMAAFVHESRQRIQVSIQDITQEKLAEQERKKLENQLRQAQKMESIGTLAGGIAHDFNNILFPISGYAEILLEDLPPDSPWRDQVEKILTASQRAKELVRQILTFSRETEHELRPMVLHPVLKEALKLIQASIPSTIRIRQQIRTDTGHVMGDPTQIHQVVMNLCTNAFHAMEDTGGELSVGLDQADLDEWDVKNLGIEPGTYVRMTVADTGCGMNKAVVSQIFAPYFTTKKKGKGTGLGLSVVHGIVTALGGNINVYTEKDQGTRFSVYLPVVQAEDRIEKTNADTRLRTGTERVLLVDDEPMIVGMARAMLERMGYDVTTETNSRRALDLFTASPDKFDLIITDMTMPGLTGYQLSERIMKNRPDMPVILCTGFSETMTRDKARQVGIKGFLSKPVLRSNLSGMIRQVLDEN